MKQLLQNLRSGVIEVAEVPSPSASPGHLRIRSTCSLISAGTERMLVEFGKAGLIDKARQQPDKVRVVIDKARADGVVPTLESVFNKLDQPLPLGYCNVGIVMDVGAGVSGFDPGDRVASNGGHAEVVRVPMNLAAKVPASVLDEEAAFTVAASIGLQGVRLVQPTLGEAVVVTGLGLIGLLTVQLLRAHGCRVMGIDLDASRLALARQWGAEVVDLSAGEDPVSAAHAFSRGRGADAVIITASTKSSEPVHQAALISRKRGRIVLVGVTGLELSRADFYEKELSFQVSCSYGPGRYDREYEEKGIDYPVGFVRWTEQRNFEAVLDMLADRRLDVRPLISHRFAIDGAQDAYDVVAGSGPSLGILLNYGQTSNDQLRSATVELRSSVTTSAAARPRAPAVAFVGAGNYAGAVLIPAFKDAGAALTTIVSAGGISGVHAGRKFGFERTTTDASTVFSDPRINTIVIATRHDSHARFCCEALAAGKHVFVEKPLALTEDELDRIDAVYQASERPLIMVGFNRRFAPHVQRMKTLLGAVRDPKVFIMTVNAGALPPSHWTQDPAVGGGRVLGEGCHFIDLLRFLAGAPIAAADAVSIGKRGAATVADDKATITLRFDDGSMGTIHYLANGHKSFPKERVEVFAAGAILQMDNFRSLEGYGWPGFSSMRLWRQDKGQKACAAAFVRAVEAGGPSPIPYDELMEVSRVTVEVAGRLRL